MVNVAKRLCRKVVRGLNAMRKLRLALKFGVVITLYKQKENRMDKPLALDFYTGVNEHSSGAGEALRWRLVLAGQAKASLKRSALFHNAEGVKLDSCSGGTMKLLFSVCQIFWQNVGDRSCDPVLTLMVNVAKRLCRKVVRGLNAMRKLRLALKFGARSLVIESAFYRL
jgi:hypothetical protein